MSRVRPHATARFEAHIAARRRANAEVFRVAAEDENAQLQDRLLQASEHLPGTRWLSIGGIVGG